MGLAGWQKKILAVFASFLRITHLESTKRSQNRVQKRTKTYRTHCFSGAFLPLSQFLSYRVRGRRAQVDATPRSGDPPQNPTGHCNSGIAVSPLNFPEPPQSRTRTYRHFSRPLHAGGVRQRFFPLFASFLLITPFESTKRSQNREQKRTKTYWSCRPAAASRPALPRRLNHLFADI